VSEKWNLNGTYLEACNCEAACPCVFLSPPTEGDCTALVAWHIDKGSFGDVPLNGLNVVLVVYTPGHMLHTKWQTALYLDDRATAAQGDALTQIYSGQAGGPFEALGGHVGEVLGVKSAAIDIQTAGKTRSLRIADVADVEIEAITDADGVETTISNSPRSLVGRPFVAAKSKQLSYRDHGFEWQISGRNGFFAPFNYQVAG
jgi:hypothetical protein